jgi:hypothetical protein
MVSKLKIKKVMIKANPKTELIEVTITLDSSLLDDSQINDLSNYVNQDVEIHTKG